MYVNVAHSIGSETLFKITGTCGQDPMVLLIVFFLTSIFFSCTQHFATFYVSLYDIYTTNKNNQTAVSIHTGLLTYA